MSLSALGVLVVVFGACDPPERSIERDPLSHLPRHEEQRRALCERGRVDAVTTALCGTAPPALTSLLDLQRLLDVSLEPSGGVDEIPGFSLIGHSSALPARVVSAINPGSVIVSLPQDPRVLNGAPGRRRTDGNIVTVAFARGDQMVELAVTAPGGEISFYIVRYEQACNGGEAGPGGLARCGFEELLTERTESGWTRWSLYDDEDLKDSVLDCLHCHQTEGPGTPRIYRMQELENPWTHWHASFTLGGRVLLDDTVAAHGLEGTIAGIPGRLVSRSNPVVVEDLVRFADDVQPNVFPAPQIEHEVQESSPGQPADNSTPGTSPSWQVVYDAAVRGEAIPPPYHDVKVTDPEKLARATADLVAWREGTLASLPDIRDVFADEALAGMSHRPKPGLDGRGILVHACGQCHNPRLDQSLSRARFDAMNIDGMSREERELAVERMRLPKEDRYRMPPHLFRDLSPEEIDAAARALGVQ